MYVAHDVWKDPVRVVLSANLPGERWVRGCDAAHWMEGADDCGKASEGDAPPGPDYALAPRSVLILIEKRVGPARPAPVRNWRASPATESEARPQCVKECRATEGRDRSPARTL